MPRDVRSLLADAAQAGRAALAFVENRSPSDLLSDPLLRSAVRYQLLVIGEALGQLARSAPQVSSSVPELQKIVGFRNVLAHDYSKVNEDVVWDVVKHKIPKLLPHLDRLLRELGDADLR